MIAVFVVAVLSTAALLGMALSPVTMIASLFKDKNWFVWVLLGLAFIVNAIWVGFRVISLAMLAAASTTCLIVVLVTHWIIMFFWIMNDRKETSNSRCGDLLFSIPAATLYELYYVNMIVLPSEHEIFSSFFFMIVSYENVCAIALFFIDPTMNTTNCVITSIIFFVGIGIICLVKFKRLFSQSNVVEAVATNVEDCATVARASTQQAIDPYAAGSIPRPMR